MDYAEEHRRKAKYFLTLAQHMSRSEDRTAMLSMAAHWMERAEEAERGNRTVQQQQQVEPKKEPEGEHS